MTNLQAYLDQANKIGTYAADLEAGADQARGTQDEIHHLGDDTGDLITEVYREHGAVAAVDVIDAYLDAFNARRAADGIQPVSPAHAIKNLAWAIKPTGITADEQQQVRDAFARRHP